MSDPSKDRGQRSDSIPAIMIGLVVVGALVAVAGFFALMRL